MPLQVGQPVAVNARREIIEDGAANAEYHRPARLHGNVALDQELFLLASPGVGNNRAHAAYG